MVKIVGFSLSKSRPGLCLLKLKKGRIEQNKKRKHPQIFTLLVFKKWIRIQNFVDPRSDMDSVVRMRYKLARTVDCLKIIKDKASNASPTNADLVSYAWGSRFNLNASLWALHFNSNTSLWAPRFNSNASLWVPLSTQTWASELRISDNRMKSASKSEPRFCYNCQPLLGQLTPTKCGC